MVLSDSPELGFNTREGSTDPSDWPFLPRMCSYMSCCIVLFNDMHDIVPNNLGLTQPVDLSHSAGLQGPVGWLTAVGVWSACGDMLHLG